MVLPGTLEIISAVIDIAIEVRAVIFEMLHEYVDVLHMIGTVGALQ